jgi:hypothetical protein
MAMSQSAACAQIGRRLLLVLAAAVMSGCGVKSSFITPYRAGQYQQAAVDATQVAESASKGDSVYYRLEQGAILRAAGQIEQSNKAFDIADDTIHKYDDEPEVKLSQETAAAFTNLSTLEYRGFCYDRIMLNVYKALNCMELGKLDAARVELARVYERQKEAVDRYAKKIEKDKALREAAASKKDASGYDVSKAEDDKRFQASRARPSRASTTWPPTRTTSTPSPNTCTASSCCPAPRTPATVRTPSRPSSASRAW